MKSEWVSVIQLSQLVAAQLEEIRREQPEGCREVKLGEVQISWKENGFQAWQYAIRDGLPIIIVEKQSLGIPLIRVRGKEEIIEWNVADQQSLEKLNDWIAEIRGREKLTGLV